MQDINRYNEIDEIDKNEDFDEFNDSEPYNELEKKLVNIPIVQTILCVIILFGLLFLKYFDDENYKVVTDWYKTSMSQEIELPKLRSEISSKENSRILDEEDSVIVVSEESRAEINGTEEQAI